jgi:hypothetical protein
LAHMLCIIHRRKLLAFCGTFKLISSFIGAHHYFTCTEPGLTYGCPGFDTVQWCEDWYQWFGRRKCFCHQD